MVETEQASSTSPFGGGSVPERREGWWEVYFTDPATFNDPENWRGSLEHVLIGYINSAEHTIHIAAFEFNLDPLAEALIAAHDRGVEIIWITDDEHGLEADEEDGRGQFELLDEAGIEILDDGRTALMHNKFIVFDNQTVWTGSTNLTRNGMFRNNNNVIVIHDEIVAAIYELEFTEMLGGEFGPKSPSRLDVQYTEKSGFPIQVLFAAEDEVVDQLIPIVASADSEILFMAFSFTNDALGNAILERAEASVDVAGVFEKRGSETQFSQLTPMYCADLAVLQDGNPGTMHHKVIIIDRSIVITGSLNFSDNANDSNDENVFIVSSPEIAAEYVAEFDRIWDQGSPPDPADIKCR